MTATIPTYIVPEGPYRMTWMRFMCASEQKRTWIWRIFKLEFWVTANSGGAIITPAAGNEAPSFAAGRQW